MKNKLFFLSACCFLLLVEISSGQGSTKSAALLAVENEIKTLQEDTEIKTALWSVCVMDVNSGKILVSRNSDQSLMPASVMKVVTTASALALLDSTFTFDTRLQYTGTIDPATGTLHGNIYITGGGDPTLGSKRFGAEVSIDSVFGSFCRTFIKKGIKSVDGYVIGDESIFDYLLPRSWGWEDIGNYYGSNACGLNVNENMYRLYFNSGAKNGDSARLVKVEPLMPGLRFINNVKTYNTTTSDDVFILGAPYTDLRILDGEMPIGKKNFDVDGAMPDPAMYCTRIFTEYLESKGIKVNKGYTTLREEQWKATGGLQDTAKRNDLAVHHSPSLGKIIFLTNMKSINLYAECMLKMIGVKKGGEGTVKAGFDAIRSYWLTYFDKAGFRMYDGSGLSRKNMITTEQLCRVLAVMYSSAEFIPFYRSLPVAGRSGTMRNHLKGTFAEGNLVSKTGTMDGVDSYAGYVSTKSKKDLAFAIIFNNFDWPNWAIRKKCDRLLQLISELD